MTRANKERNTSAAGTAARDEEALKIMAHFGSGA